MCVRVRVCVYVRVCVCVCVTRACTNVDSQRHPCLRPARRLIWDVWHDSTIHMTHLMHTWGFTHCIWLIFHIHGWNEMCDMTQPYTWHVSCIRGDLLIAFDSYFIYMGEMRCVTWLNSTRDMLRAYVGHYVLRYTYCIHIYRLHILYIAYIIALLIYCIYVTWLMYLGDMTYAVMIYDVSDSHFISYGWKDVCVHVCVPVTRIWIHQSNRPHEMNT